MSGYLLFANPSFIEGIARVLDLGSTMNDYNSFPLPEQADYYALKSDWEAIGTDLKNAMAQYERRMNDHGQT